MRKRVEHEKGSAERRGGAGGIPGASRRAKNNGRGRGKGTHRSLIPVKPSTTFWVHYPRLLVTHFHAATQRARATEVKDDTPRTDWKEDCSFICLATRDRCSKKLLEYQVQCLYTKSGS